MEPQDKSAPVPPAPGYPGSAPGYPGAQPPYGYPQYPPGPGQYAPGPGQYPPGFPGAPGQPPYGFQPVQQAYGVPPVAGQPNGPPGAMWMPAPPSIPNCPPGLEYLSQIDQILIHQQIELLEVLTGFETANKYEIKNAMGQRVYFAAEENDCCTLNCCGPSRPFTMKILDNVGQEVIELRRPLRCSSCCCPCCLQELEVHAPPGTPVGYIKQLWDPCLPKFAIQNEAQEEILRVVGPCIVCSCCEDINFEVKSKDEKNNVGRISKQWTGFVREAFTDADNFGIQFPQDLDVKMKAVMIGACFLIDFMFFEHSGQNRQQRAGVW
ncbi:phospholipid scramblase 2-like [Podarcis raffonei]|uniref:phospholipid scramblase 2-like n=1 Tax=Podarcis raffonei TaxID=65483 RepID=UPI0023294952|nr:phospholipid scramblase 2-like [Podarcis raffonei]XP_053246177.1 phospholipid scramblase 2-like [Podarcis raffonei]